MLPCSDGRLGSAEPRRPSSCPYPPSGPRLSWGDEVVFGLDVVRLDFGLAMYGAVRHDTIVPAPCSDPERPRVSSGDRLPPHPSTRGKAELSHPCDKMIVMSDEPDFRADKSDTAEGAAKAAGRRAAYQGRLDEDVLAEAFPMSALDDHGLPDFVRDDIAADAMEQSELIGFWVAWHLAGGFTALEEGGWHRATIFRKVGVSAPATAWTSTSTRFPGSRSTSRAPGRRLSSGASQTASLASSTDRSPCHRQRRSPTS